MYKYHTKEETTTELRWKVGKAATTERYNPNIAQFRASAQSEHCVSIYEARTAPLL